MSFVNDSPWPLQGNAADGHTWMMNALDTVRRCYDKQIGMARTQTKQLLPGRPRILNFTLTMKSAVRRGQKQLVRHTAYRAKFKL